MKKTDLNQHVFLIEEFLSEMECDELIQLSESGGFKEATVSTERGEKLVKDVRNNSRFMKVDLELANSLWARLKNQMPMQLGNSKAIGLNELFRFYRYLPGQKFKRHIDESFIRNELESSYYTFMIYLNDDFEGGETTFDDLLIKKKKGQALVFLHSIPHEGSEVTKGVKYVLRSDVMYKLEELQ